MTEQVNGYLTASQLLTKAVNDSIVAGVTLDEVFAALKVQCEVINLRFTQVMVENNQRQAIEAYQNAQAQAAEGETNAN